ncbi:hypothetical protein POPTR_007G038000v4 [Populus trichocarpa]|uniref:Uncharacterized protein n=4 Tax=Populus trichocarpa TaxID=3694 RepID=A0ACC0SP79_POPTR|nr:hypothetical protein BDE02_07G034900 [Populus trichocarpa]KAI5581694.1 hypothetical protein BDE02_07G034900 [Populus trichocarpa]KAI5581696.1 hypothetical protein BDE02_07G034900 [Populus trichocarpa]KAI5581697.1 hypothetical protein BDE02_07G034900 [Populus trichocarpa]KAI9391056.1 hypothetical protein POPTR_007G038000v4 [Populus trichocarpa]
MDRILPAEQIKSCLYTKLACGLFLIGESGTYKSLTSLDDELLGSENFLLTTYMSRIFPCSNQEIRTPILDDWSPVGDTLIIPLASQHCLPSLHDIL